MNIQISRKVLSIVLIVVLALVTVFLLVYANNQRSEGIALSVMHDDDSYAYDEHEYQAPPPVTTAAVAVEPEYLAQAVVYDAPPLPIVVYVSGQVYAPGVFRFYEGDRIYAAVEAAGGFMEYADRSALNLAALLYDTQHIIVHHIEDNAPLALSSPIDQDNQNNQTNQAVQAAPSWPVNINTASAVDLQRLRGIGPALSQAIISHRENNGHFTSIEQIMNVSGIGPGIFGNIRDYITTN